MKSSFPRALPRPLTVAECLALGEAEDVALHGDADHSLVSVASPDEADAGSICFLRGRGPGVAKAAAPLRAGLLLAETPVEAPGVAAVAIVSDACRFMASVLTALLPEEEAATEHDVHPDARIDASARLGRHVVVEADVEVGPGCRIDAHAVLHAGTRLGRGCRIGAGSVIGRSDDSPYRSAYGPYRLPSVGQTRLEDEVTVGAHTTIVRGVLSDTWLGSRVLVGNQVNVGRNCRLGEGAAVYVGAMLCGSAELGENASVGAGACLNNGVRVGAGAQIGLGAVVTRHVRAGERVFGNPARRR
ncbi:MAG: DapH/DapD/GlmU-related protein [Myxococcota bacterium]|nr:DapH/DapD/GlmU-related protein [Myxococcota bacterium]